MDELADLSIEQLRELCVQRENDARLAAHIVKSLLTTLPLDFQTVWPVAPPTDTGRCADHSHPHSKERRDRQIDRAAEC